jgi:hypothetical protein
MQPIPFTYCQFLLTSPLNYTQTYLADHVQGLSHDRINRALQKVDVSPQDLWNSIQETLVLSPNGYLLFDDTVVDKNRSEKIEGVRKQYSGNAHGVIKGIGIVTCVYVNPQTSQFLAVDYRIYNPDEDQKSKLDHVGEMLQIAQTRLSFKTVLMDSWYATQALMKQIDEMEKIYYTVVKKNRLVDETQGVQAYQKIQDLTWSEEELKLGKRVKLHHFPAQHKVQLFRVTALPNKVEFVVTNDLTQNSGEDTRKTCGIRWKIEEFHRELKQLTGIESCQCRKAILQKNHIGCAMLVWARLKNLAYQTKQTIYGVYHSQYHGMISSLLAQPIITFA